MSAPSTEALRERAVDRKGGAILLWVVAWLVLAGAVASRAGLKYAEVAGWPSDIYAFATMPHDDMDIVVMGSSKASYSIPPDLVTSCLRKRAHAEVRVANLGRMYGTAWSVWTLIRDLFPQHPPKVLLLGLEAELFDDHNARLIESFPWTAEIEDVPALLPEAASWSGAVAFTRTLTRGAEHLSGYAFSAAAVDPHIRWLMLGYGGGQWCYSDACRAPIRDRWKADYRMWDHRLEVEIPFMRAERYGRSTIGEGINARATDQILAWAAANGVTVAGAVMPLHKTFSEQIPEELDAQFEERLHDLEARGVTVWSPNMAKYADNRQAFVDPEHLNPNGAQTYMSELCGAMLVPLWQKVAPTPP